MKNYFLKYVIILLKIFFMYFIVLTKFSFEMQYVELRMKGCSLVHDKKSKCTYISFPFFFYLYLLLSELLDILEIYEYWDKIISGSLHNYNGANKAR